MSRFARIEEEAIKYQSELTGEELRLFVLIKFHTWNDSGVCNKNLRELSNLYGLIYNHTTERYKSLRKKGWCENTKQGIKPIAGLKTSFYKPADTPNIGVSKTPNIGVSEEAKLQISEFPLKEYIEPFKDEKFIDTTHGEKSAGVRVKNGNNLSKFSLSECFDYVERCQAKGDEIRNPRALAITIHKSGEADAFISAALYPEQSTTEQTVEYDAPDPRREALEILLDMRRSDVEIESQRQFFSKEDWAWLMTEMKSYVE